MGTVLCYSLMLRRSISGCSWLRRYGDCLLRERNVTAVLQLVKVNKYHVGARLLHRQTVNLDASATAFSLRKSEAAER